MTLFPLDAVRHARIDHDLEPILEDVRESLATFPSLGGYEPSDALAAYDMARPRLNVLVSALQPFSDQNGADISTGLGFLPVILQRRGIGVVATERDLVGSAFARGAGIEVKSYCLGRDRPPFAASSLDFLVFAEVLEHLKVSPVSVLSELASLLRPGGKLFLTTPNVARLHHIELLAAGENFLEPFPADLQLSDDATDFIEHVREYSIREVVDAVEASGLAVERIMMTGWGQAGYDPPANPYAAEIIVLVATR